ncbi:mediator of RNA polymerase II transcription subunit 11 [[Candida] jaroonii]|uniref:Mediator of RNA polymerase II transcription subunit 11 n=1 Tax=[Candida] jaroonii TaxID=467808 RepID=A0ACA9Y4G2_9ASCO|nr:mediator of RNA polymerase II transcription subunit 11 [[Candida] jaroonii]
MPGKESFIEKRLKSLDEIDSSVVELLDNMSKVFDKYANANSNYDDAKKQITDQTKMIYQNISDIAINLRKEVKIMDENIGRYDQNEDSVMILPIAVDQKNTKLGKRRLQEELEQLKTLLPEEPTEEQKMLHLINAKDKKVEETKRPIKEESSVKVEIKDDKFQDNKKDDTKGDMKNDVKDEPVQIDETFEDDDFVVLN